MSYIVWIFNIPVSLPFFYYSKIRVAFNHLEARKMKMTPEEAANETAIELVEAAEVV